jgi:hypothetical protein
MQAMTTPYHRLGLLFVYHTSHIVRLYSVPVRVPLAEDLVFHILINAAHLPNAFHNINDRLAPALRPQMIL